MGMEMVRPPDSVTVHTDTGRIALDKTADGEWGRGDVSVMARLQGNDLPVKLAASHSAVMWVHLWWRCELAPGLRILGDAWERGYGDLEWRGVVPQRPLPWYFLTYDGSTTDACGVETAAHSFCFWQIDTTGFSLWLDVRCGGCGVQLGNRTLTAAVVVAREGSDGETPFEAARAFCKMLCAAPRLPARPVYGGNDWYYAYGSNSQEQILDDAALIAELAPTGGNRPFMVIDSGWQLGYPGCSGGPWLSNRKFPNMHRLASEIRRLTVRPGLWTRPLLTLEGLPESWLLPKKRFTNQPPGNVMDPTVPDVLAQVADDIRTFTGWGYELIKHDFTTWDLLGKWGFEMGADITSPGWHFADRSVTTAEALLGLYRTIREAAGDALIIGCNTVGHLTAGLHELQRTGDDTSGSEWERTRRMGVNTLAFRAPQHEAFFAADADCVGLTNQVPWEMNWQWLDLLARSGTALFVSADPKAVGPQQRTALKQAFDAASRPQPVGEPLDWLDTTCPARWILNGQRTRFNWFGDEGAWPF